MENKIIPQGIYCYDEKGVCPYWKQKTIDCINVKYIECEYTKMKSICNGYVEDLETKLLSAYGNNENIDREFSSYLLFDQVKECNINDEEDFSI